jgi:electron transport complex protein RnfB
MFETALAVIEPSVLLLSVAGLTGLGLVFGLSLAIVSRKFRVEVDPRIEQVTALLPGLNCGACGFPGCSGYAEALVAGGAAIGLCPPSSAEANSRIAALLGREAGRGERRVAFLHCAGGKHAKRRYLYDGIRTCAAASLVGGGDLGCEFGCLAFYDCIAKCPFGAIEVDETGMPRVDPGKCTGCTLCVNVCPRHLLTMFPVSKTIAVACSNTERGKFTRLVCDIGCIGCHKCAKVCPVDAIEMREGVAFIRHEKCTMCGECVKVCPKNIIHDFSKPIPERRVDAEPEPAKSST